MSSTSSTPKLKLTLKLSSSSAPSTSSLSTSLANSQNPSPSSATLPSNGNGISLSIAANAGEETAPATPLQKRALKKPKKNARLLGMPTADAVSAGNGATRPFDLKAFVGAMKELHTRSWLLQRPVSLKRAPNAMSMTLSSGAWTVFSESLQRKPRLSENLVDLLADQSAPSIDAASFVSASMPASANPLSFACHCGKVFADRTKFRKHQLTHSEEFKAARRKGRKARKTMESTTAPESTASQPVPAPILKIRLKPLPSTDGPL